MFCGAVSLATTAALPARERSHAACSCHQEVGADPQQVSAAFSENLLHRPSDTWQIGIRCVRRFPCTALGCGGALPFALMFCAMMAFSRCHGCPVQVCREHFAPTGRRRASCVHCGRSAPSRGDVAASSLRPCGSMASGAASALRAGLCSLALSTVPDWVRACAACLARQVGPASLPRLRWQGGGTVARGTWFECVWRHHSTQLQRMLWHRAKGIRFTDMLICSAVVCATQGGCDVSLESLLWQCPSPGVAATSPPGRSSRLARTSL